VKVIVQCDEEEGTEGDAKGNEGGQVKDSDRVISIHLSRVFALLCSLSMPPHTFFLSLHYYKQNCY